MLSLDRDPDLVRAFERPWLGEVAGRLWKLEDRVVGWDWGRTKQRDSGGRGVW